MAHLLAFLARIDRKLALRIGLGILALAIVLLAWRCARESGREAEALETRQETAETVEQLEETYERIEQSRADDDDGVVVKRLRDGSFLAGDTGGEAPLSAD